MLGVIGNKTLNQRVIGSNPIRPIKKNLKKQWLTAISLLIKKFAKNPCGTFAGHRIQKRENA